MSLPPSIPLFPLSNALFPSGVLRLRIFEVRYLDMIRRCLAEGTEFGVVILLEGSEVRQAGKTELLGSVGTMARIESCEAPMPTLLELTCVGTTRFRLASSEPGKYGLWHGQGTVLADDAIVPIPPTLQGGADALGRLIARLQKQGVPGEQMPMAAPFRLDECGWVANRWAELLALPPQLKQALLGQDDPMLRLAQVQALLAERGLLD